MSEHVLEHLSTYLDGALGAAEKERFRAHLADCPSCANRLEELAGVDRALRALPSLAPEGYFEALPSRVRNRLSAARPPQRRLLKVPLWAVAAAAAMTVGVLAPLTLLQKPMSPQQSSVPLRDQAAAPAAAEVDKFDQDKRADRSPPAAMAQVPTPVATAAPAEDFRLRAETKTRALGEAKAETAPASLENAPQARAPEAPQPPPATAAPAAGFATPPRDADRAAQQSGPRANQQAELRKQVPMRQSADAQAEAPELGRRAQRAMETKQTKDAAVPPEGARESSEKKTAPARTAGLAAATQPAPQARFRELEAHAPRDAGEARALRESWRRFSAEAADLALADEARVRVIEMGALAWRLEKRLEDRALAEKDAAAYLARADGRHSDRVRSLIAAVGR